MVINGRYKPPSGRLELRLPAPCAVGRVVIDIERAAAMIEAVGRGQAIGFFGRHVECRVFHSQRIEDALPEERAERLARHTRDQDPEDVAADMIQPLFARLCHPGQRSERVEPLLRARRLRRQGRTVAADSIFTHQFLNRIRIGHRHHAAEAHAEGEQIAHGDRTLRGNRVVGLRGDRFEHATARKFRQPRLHGFIEPQLALLDQNHGGNGGDRLGERSDAKDRVALHRRRIAKRQGAERLDMYVIMMTDQRDDPGNLLALDISRQHLMHSLEPRLGKTCSAHIRFLAAADSSCFHFFRRRRSTLHRAAYFSWRRIGLQQTDVVCSDDTGRVFGLRFDIARSRFKPHPFEDDAILSGRKRLFQLAICDP